MRKTGLYILFICVGAFLSSCINNDRATYEAQLAEIDAATWNANAAGVTYPILTRRVAENRPLSTTLDSTLRRISNTARIRINMVGPQSAKDETVGYKVFGSPIATIAFPATITGQTPSQSGGTVAVSDAVAGTHFTALSGKVTIPANSSFGYIDIPILNAGATAGQARFIGIQLDSTGSVMPSPNYNKVGLVIDQR